MSARWLAVDVGNTQTVAGLFEVRNHDGRHESHCLKRLRFRTQPEATGDDWRRLLGDALAADRVISASVVPSLHRTLGEAFAGRLWHGIDSHTPRRFELAIPHPEQMGADRLANIMGALARFEPPFLIVDSGTATTFCLVDENRRYLGGAIVPGMETALEALKSRAARLFQVELTRPENAVGNTTERQLQSGMIQGTEALIEGFAERLLRDAGPRMERATKIVTGGCVNYLKLSSEFVVAPDLTLEGLLEYGWEISRHE